MSKIFFTSDTHFSQERTLELTRRPFNSVQEMDDTMIKNWNELVDKDDTVYHLGDFGNIHIAKKLNGKIILILGNYEVTDMEKLGMTFSEYSNILINHYGFHQVYEHHFNFVKDKNNLWYLVHKPVEHNNLYFNMFGHIHRSVMIKPYGLNVGTDCHFYKPVTIETVKFYKNALDKKYYDENVFDNKVE